jgi:hypothetical protein
MRDATNSRFARKNHKRCNSRTLATAYAINSMGVRNIAGNNQNQGGQKILTTRGKPAKAGTLAIACTPKKKGFNRIWTATQHCSKRKDFWDVNGSKNNKSSRIDTNKRKNWNF